MVVRNLKTNNPPYTASELADHLASTLQSPDDYIIDDLDTIRTSDDPLSEPLIAVWGTPVSIASNVRYTILRALGEQCRSIVDQTFADIPDAHEVGLYTHPEVLETDNQLLPSTALAKAYQYGYWPSFFTSIEDANFNVPAELTTDNPSGIRSIELTHSDSTQSTYRTRDNWFEDSTAVRELSQQTTSDDTDWEHYIPWYHASSRPAYRLQQEADIMDWSALPDPPTTAADRPTIDTDSGRAQAPPLGDFIRTAVLQYIETTFPSVQNISTGPDPWATDHVTVDICPQSRDDPGINPYSHCPPVVLFKLNKFGYRPIDGWITDPTKGSTLPDPDTTRRLKVARGQTLRTWVDQTLADSSLDDDTTILENNSYLTGLDWDAILPCLRSRLFTRRELSHFRNPPLK